MRATIGAVAGVIVIAVAAAVILTRFDTSPASLDAAPLAQPRASDAHTPESPAPCSPAPFLVGRLPWIPPGTTIPEPEQLVEGEASILVWFEDPAAEWSGRYVALTRSTKTRLGDIEEFPTAVVRDVTGRVVWVGDPGVGQLTLAWTEGSDACSSYSLSISSVGLTERGAESELRAIADSLA